MTRKWTEEERKKQADRIRRTCPWRHATGPRTHAGKERAKMNACKHGFRSQAYRKLRLALRQQAQFIKSVRLCRIRFPEIYQSDRLMNWLRETMLPRTRDPLICNFLRPPPECHSVMMV